MRLRLFEAFDLNTQLKGPGLCTTGLEGFSPADLSNASDPVAGLTPEGLALVPCDDDAATIVCINCIGFCNKILAPAVVQQCRSLIISLT